MIHILINTTDPFSRVRLVKLVELMQKQALSFELLCIGDGGCERNAFQGVRVGLLSERGTRTPRPLQYIVWMLTVFWWALSNRRKIDHVYAIGLDSALPAAVALPGRVIFDNADNFFLSIKWPLPIKATLRRLELMAIGKSYAHLVPGPERIVRPSPKDVVLPNTPSRQSLALAKDVLRSRPLREDRRLTLYVNGWLVETRGIGTLLAAIQSDPDCSRWLRVLVAGHCGGKSSEALVALDGVEYFGPVSNEVALSLYWESDLAYTVYDPSVEINRLALPNKWGDCLATGTPFICNSEIITAREYVEAGSCLTFNHGDISELLAKLRQVSESPQQLQDLRLAISQISWSFWDDALLQFLSSFVEEKGVIAAGELPKSLRISGIEEA